MVRLSLPIVSIDEIEVSDKQNDTHPSCDGSQVLYGDKYCLKESRFCSDDYPCPSGIPCVDRVCQCMPNKHSFITLAPPPLRMYTLGCNFDTNRHFDHCREYEYGVQSTCLLNYCSSDIPCYAGTCDREKHMCVDINATRVPLPPNTNSVIVLGDNPMGFYDRKEGMSPLLIIIAAAMGVVGIAILIGLVRMVMLSVQSSVRWASRSQRLPSGDEKYDDKDKPDFVDVEQKAEQNLGANLNRSPSKFTGAHFVPYSPLDLSNTSSPDSTPLPSPQFSLFSRHGDNHESSVAIEMSGEQVGTRLESRDPSCLRSYQKSEVMEDRSPTLPPTTLASPFEPEPVVVTSPTYPPSAYTAHISSTSLSLPASPLTSSPLPSPSLQSPPLQSPNSQTPPHPHRSMLRYSLETSAMQQHQKQYHQYQPEQQHPPSMHMGTQTITPASRNLPAGFASSPVAKSAERFDV